MSEVTVVRIYVNERDAHLDRLLARLKGEEGVRGLTVFRGITGYGDSGKLHGSHLVDLLTDLPLVVEFYETPERATMIIEHLKIWLKPGHVISWPARLELD